MRKALPWIPIAGAVVIALFAASLPALQFAKLDGGQFMSRLGALLVLALLIERTVEVFLTIVLTAALLAGGADPIHKLMDAFRKFMEASASKASGTVK